MNLSITSSSCLFFSISLRVWFDFWNETRVRLLQNFSDFNLAKKCRPLYFDCATMFGWQYSFGLLRWSWLGFIESSPRYTSKSWSGLSIIQWNWHSVWWWRLLVSRMILNFLLMLNFCNFKKFMIKVFHVREMGLSCVHGTNKLNWKCHFLVKKWTFLKIFPYLQRHSFKTTIYNIHHPKTIHIGQESYIYMRFVFGVRTRPNSFPPYYFLMPFPASAVNSISWPW